MAVDAFGSLAADAIEAAQQTFETANVLEEEQGLDLSKLARPTSTWKSRWTLTRVNTGTS